MKALNRSSTSEATHKTCIYSNTWSRWNTALLPELHTKRASIQTNEAAETQLYFRSYTQNVQLFKQMKPLNRSSTSEATHKSCSYSNKWSPWTAALLRKLNSKRAAIQTKPSFYTTWWLGPVFAADVHRAVFWARLIQSSSLYLLLLLHYPSI